MCDATEDRSPTCPRSCGLSEAPLMQTLNTRGFWEKGTGPREPVTLGTDGTKLQQLVRLVRPCGFLPTENSWDPAHSWRLMHSYFPLNHKRIGSLFSYSFSSILFSSICFFTVFLPLLPPSFLILITIEIQGKYTASVLSRLPYSEGKFQVREKGTEQARNFGARGHWRDHGPQISLFTNENNETRVHSKSVAIRTSLLFRPIIFPTIPGHHLGSFLHLSATGHLLWVSHWLIKESVKGISILFPPLTTVAIL